MKYLFINEVVGTTSTGKLVADQYRKVVADHNEAIVAYGRWARNCDDVKIYRIGTDNDVCVHGIMTRMFDKHGLSSTRATEKFVTWAEEYNPDIVWIHNLHGYYINYELLFGWIKQHPEKKIYWTLHDCWSFTGHCSHFMYVKCDKWKNECSNCPQSKQYPTCLLFSNTRDNYKRKKTAFTGIRDLTIITPSHWLEEIVKQSFLKEYPVEVLYNTINTDIFKPTPSNFRQEHNLENKIILLGVANVWNDRKGLRDFVKLNMMLDDRYQIVLIGLSRQQISKLPNGILGMTKTDDAFSLAKIYSAADVFINPSKEETFGLTVLEAESCGTNVIVYKNTACEEVINIKENNRYEVILKAVNDDVQSIKDAIDNLTK